MSIPQQLNAQGNDGTGSERVPRPVDLTSGNILPLLAAIMGGRTLLNSYRRVKSDRTPIKLSILMCAYNEERTIARAVSEVLTVDYPCDMELIVVDDGSTDTTPMLLANVANDPRLIIHHHPRNRGKGAALVSAASLASGTHILPFDADLEYSPDDIARVIHPVLTGRTDVVYGVRIFGFNTAYHSYRYAAGNRLLTRMANILYDAWLSDLHTCLKLVPLAMFRSLNLKESGFGLDTEMTALLLKAGIRPFEVPVSYFSRSHIEGKKITWRDAIRCMSILLRVRLLRSSQPKAIMVPRDDAKQVGVVPPQSGSPPWRTASALGARDDGQANAEVTGLFYDGSLEAVVTRCLFYDQRSDLGSNSDRSSAGGRPGADERGSLCAAEDRTL